MNSENNNLNSNQNTQTINNVSTNTVLNTQPQQEPSQPEQQETTNTNVQNTTQINEVTMEVKQKREVLDMKMPEIHIEQKTIETVKKKQKSSLPYVLLILFIAFLVIYKMEDIINIFDKLTTKTNPLIVNDEKDNMVEGYLLLNDTSSNIKINSIKFYNFVKKTDSLMITYNYVSEKNIEDLIEKNIYIELYNSEKEVIYKSKFYGDNRLDKGVVKSDSIIIDNYAYENVKYILVKEYSEDDINKEELLICSFEELNENNNLIYRNIYSFKNGMLYSYQVSKQINIIVENKDNDKYINELKAEYNMVNENGIDSIYDNNSLSYTIYLNDDLGTFIPVYEKNTTINIVKNNEIQKKWNCE